MYVLRRKPLSSGLVPASPLNDVGRLRVSRFVFIFDKNNRAACPSLLASLLQ